MSLPHLTGDRVELREIRDEDIPRLLDLLDDDSNREYWGTFDEARFREEIIDVEYGETFVVLVEGLLAGVVHFEEETHPDYRRADLDIFLGAEYQDHGLGPDALRTVARYLFGQRGHHAIDISPAADNKRAIAAYKKVGFKEQGLVRMAERIDGREWHDALRMDMLREDLTD